MRWCDDFVHDNGAVGVLLGPSVVSGAVVSQGCRPIGQAYVVTRATDNVIHDLAGQQGKAALVFTCNGRGSALFGEPDHDARVVHDQVGRGAVAGMSCAGEVGPIGNRDFVHTFTASVVLFDS